MPLKLKYIIESSLLKNFGSKGIPLEQILTILDTNDSVDDKDQFVTEIYDGENLGKSFQLVSDGRVPPNGNWDSKDPEQVKDQTQDKKPDNSMPLRSLVLVVPDEVGKYSKREVVVVAIRAVEQCDEAYYEEIVLEVLWFFHSIY